MRFKIDSEKSREAVLSKIAKLSDKKPWSVEIVSYKKPVSPSQRGLYRLWLAALYDQTGANADVMHEYFKGLFLPTVIFTVGGEEIPGTKSTETLGTVEYNKYLEDVCLWMTDRGVEVYWPDAIRWEEFFNRYNTRVK